MKQTTTNAKMSNDSADGVQPLPGEPAYSVDQMLEIAQRLHRSGNLEDARAIYEAILERRPDDPMALHFLGVLTHQSGDSRRAVELIRRSIERMPGNPGFHNNHGNVLLESGRIDEAAEAYQRCIDLAPDAVEPHNNLGTIRCARGDLPGAEAAYKRAIELCPDFPGAYCNLANLLLTLGRPAESAKFAFHAITLDSSLAVSKKVLAYAYYMDGKLDQAAEVYRKWLDEEPESPIARHHLSACTGIGVPSRAADDYVEATFDAFASSFDVNLEKLDYRAPELVAQAVARAYPEPAGRLHILDAGCGTGLCGPYLAPYAARLLGVDLSAQMLARAGPRRAYDELIKAELTAYLDAVPGAFDLIVSADTLCYFGSLDIVMRAAYAALRDEGVLIFTVEEATDDTGATGYCIGPHGRYSHARRYVEAMLIGAGFNDIEIAHAVLRHEAGSPVAGMVIIANKVVSG